MNKKYFYKYAISKQQQIQKESNHLFQVALLFFFLKNLIFKITTPTHNTDNPEVPFEETSPDYSLVE